MFLFNCCKGNASGPGYEVVKVNANNEAISTDFFQDMSSISHKNLNDQNTRVIKVDKSEYDELSSKFQGKDKKWMDLEFPPKETSLGNLESSNFDSWKRIPDIIKAPQLFEGQIEPKDVIQGSLEDCYFLSALAALAEEQSRIRPIFGQQGYNENGIYKVQLRIDGIIKQILIDDWIPVNKRNKPIFCQPNKGQFWVIILEKAWAKAHLSYANIASTCVDISAGTPSQVFKAVTFAPAEMVVITQSSADQEKVWRKIQLNAAKNYPVCCGTKTTSTIDWEDLGLVPGHAYTLIDAVVLEDSSSDQQRLLKLRNPWGKNEWKGAASEQDSDFWDNIQETVEKKEFMKNHSISNDGIFYMLYDDFRRYFNQVHFSLLENNANYITETFVPKKNGSVYCLKIHKTGTYSIELHQPSLRGKDADRQAEGLSRATLLLIENIGAGKNYRFIDGIMKHSEEDTLLRAQLTPGNYLVFAKLDPTPEKKLLPQDCCVSIYSSHFAEINASDPKKHPDLLSRAFLEYGKTSSKKKHYNNDLMWVSHKLLFQQGGYAFIIFSNDISSGKVFKCQFDESDFNLAHFSLKKPYKGKGKQEIEVGPGEQTIILSRVSKQTKVKSLKFPPELFINYRDIE